MKKKHLCFLSWFFSVFQLFFILLLGGVLMRDYQCSCSCFLGWWTSTSFSVIQLELPASGGAIIIPKGLMTHMKDIFYLSDFEKVSHLIKPFKQLSTFRSQNLNHSFICYRVRPYLILNGQQYSSRNPNYDT